MGQRVVFRCAAVAMLALAVACPAVADAAELAPSGLAGMVAQAIDAHKTDDGSWFFEENADGATATLVAYVGASKAPAPPAAAGGLPVTGVVAKPATGAPAITRVDLSKVAGTLESLQVYGCQLATLDASGCPKLTHLDVRENALTALKVPASLETLMCSGNELPALDVSKCTALGKLYCDGNALYALDVSKCPGLYYLDCSGNRLTTLKCGANLDLNDVFCSGNYLSDDLKALTDRYGTDKGVVLPQNSGAVPLLEQSVTASGVTVAMGKTATIGAKASAGGKLSYKSSDEKVAKVSASGVVTPVSVGTADVTVTAAATGNYGAGSATVKVTVTKGAQSVAASGVTVAMGKTATIGAKASAGGKLSYKSSDEKVAKVSASGVVTPVSVGTATVTATAAETAGYGKASATAKVTVTQGSQSLAFKAQKKKVSASKVKKKARTFAIAKATGAKTKVTYTITGNAKAKKRLTINKSTGKITVKKGTPKGKYVATVKASAAKSANWKAASKSVKVTVSVA